MARVAEATPHSQVKTRCGIAAWRRGPFSCLPQTLVEVGVFESFRILGLYCRSWSLDSHRAEECKKIPV